MQGTPRHTAGGFSLARAKVLVLRLTRVRVHTSTEGACSSFRYETGQSSRLGVFPCETFRSRCTVVHRNVMTASASPNRLGHPREGNRAAMGHYSRLSRSESQRYVTVTWALAEMGFHQPFDMATGAT